MIQSAKEKHLEEIFNIEKMVFPKPWSKKQLENDINCSVNSENWVYLKNHKVVGYILGWKIKNEYHLHNIAVHTNFQRKHIGQSLIEHIIKYFKNQDVNRIYLEVSCENIPAQKLYNSLNFNQEGMRMDYYDKGDHALLYYMDLVTNG